MSARPIFTAHPVSVQTTPHAGQYKVMEIELFSRLRGDREVLDGRGAVVVTFGEIRWRPAVRIYFSAAGVGTWQRVYQPGRHD